MRSSQDGSNGGRINLLSSWEISSRIRFFLLSRRLFFSNADWVVLFVETDLYSRGAPKRLTRVEFRASRRVALVRLELGSLGWDVRWASLEAGEWEILKWNVARQHKISMLRDVIALNVFKKTGRKRWCATATGGVGIKLLNGMSSNKRWFMSQRRAARK